MGDTKGTWRRERGGLYLVPMVTVGLVLAVATPVKAALHDRGGGLIYDDVLKITWLQDARYAPATMLWSQAVAWAEGLSYYDTVRGVTWTDWRLPQVRPVDGVGFNYAWSFDGSTDMAYNISAPGSVYPGSTGSEMAYLYSVNLGNLGFYDTNGVGPQPGYSSVPNAEFTDGTSGMTVAFENLNIGAYWSATERADIAPQYAWRFSFNAGDQAWSLKSTRLYAWPVRDGDVIPEPSSVVLLVSAMGVMAALRPRHSRRAPL